MEQTRKDRLAEMYGEGAVGRGEAAYEGRCLTALIIAINFNAAHIGWPTSDSLLVALPQLAPPLATLRCRRRALAAFGATFIGGPLRLRLAYIDVPCAEPRSARMLRRRYRGQVGQRGMRDQRRVHRRVRQGQ